jgi:hypothetical protein
MGALASWEKAAAIQSDLDGDFLSLGELTCQNPINPSNRQLASKAKQGWY